MGVSWERRITKNTAPWNVKEAQSFLDYVVKRIGTEYMGGGDQAKESIREMMRKNLQAFSNAKKAEVERTIEYISNLIGKDKVWEKMKRDLIGFVVLKQDQLEEWERKWGRDVLKSRVERYNLEYLLFVYSNISVGG